MADPTDDQDAEQEYEEEEEEEVSELGKQEHWENAYTRELSRFQESGGEDVGEVWFGEDTQAAMVGLVCRLTDHDAAAGRGPPGAASCAGPAARAGATGRAAWRAVDLGCGNGALLVALAKEGFLSLTGVDYVQSSIDLSRAVVDRAGFHAIQLQRDDVLDSGLPSGEFWLALDKGTFDAIGLQANAEEKRRQYVDTVLRVLAPGGLLVITSCNSTRDEITEEFLAARGGGDAAGSGGGGGGSSTSSRLEVVDWVRTYPVFKFMGVEGTRVCTVGFRKVLGGGAEGAGS